MKASLRSLVRSFGILAILVAMLAATASPAAADPDPNYPDCNGTWVGQEENCIPDACPDALNPGNQLPGTVCAVPAPVVVDPTPAETVPDEVFVDPAVDVDRGAGALAYGAAAAPADGGVSAEVAGVVAAVAVPSAPAPSGSGSLPLTGAGIGSMLFVALLLFVLAAYVYGEAGRAARRVSSIA